MSETPLEKAARAVFEAMPQDAWDGSLLTWDSATDEQRAFGIPIARAVLMAVREPDRDTALAIDYALIQSSSRPGAWQAGIDHILRGGETQPPNDGEPG